MHRDDIDIGTSTTNLIANELEEGRQIGSQGASSKRVEKRNKDD